MRLRAFYWGCLLTFLSLVVPSFAQQGHPLTGTWNGDWGSNPTQRTPVTIVMSWDGKDVKGIVNPGPDSSTTLVTVDVSNWTVRFETDMKDASGKMVHVSADGKLDDLGSYHRTISGTWHQGAATGTFKLTRE
ncbi:MAG TPA: hypothetical protein VH639_23145 [Bryobacteraceae bacterium]|jgi:hypothetical protein